MNRVDSSLLRERLLSSYNAVYTSSRRVLAVNIISGSLIAASVWLLGQTKLLDTFLETLIAVLKAFRNQLEQLRGAPIPMWQHLLLFALIILGTATACTFIRSMKRLLAVNVAIIAAIVTLGMSKSVVPWSAIPVVLLVTIGAIIDYYKIGRASCRERV